MKFGKEFASQMVQEWQEAYMDYVSLKRLLKDLLEHRQQTTHVIMPSLPGSPLPRSHSLKRRHTLYRAFSGLTGRHKGGTGAQWKNHEEVILVTEVEGTEESHHYRTTLLAEDGGESELLFFSRLDDEFNKVVKFYREKVGEAQSEAEELSKQMDALIALRIRVDKVDVGHRSGQVVTVSESNSVCPSPASIAASVNSENQGIDQNRMEAIEEIEMSNEVKGFKAAPLGVLDYVKINIHPETPLSTLRNVIGSSKLELSFSKEELKAAEQKLRRAIIGFYYQLRLLKNYCFLNMLAFAKIMKKYDKITSRCASKTYLEMVEKSYLGSSDEVNRLVERIEATFIKHFMNGNRRKAMKSLRPGHKRERHRTTFFLGLFSGCSLALVVALIVIIHVRNILNHEGRDQYMENLFPLYSLFLFIILHMVMYGWNTYLWRRFRVNYSFIFGFKPGTELGFREVFLLASGLSLLALAAVLANLDMEMDPRTQNFIALTEMVPLGLVVVVLLITFCPFNIIYRSSRFFLLRSVWHCMCAPLYKVTLPDFFLADQLTSQVQAFRCLQFYVCYYGWGDFTKRSNTCVDSDIYEILYIVVAVIPFLSRFLQCLRRFFEEKDAMQGLNGLKYLSTIVALVMRTIYDLRRGTIWRIMAASTSGVTTIYNTYWDIVMDWGLLQKDAKNPWLREKLLISNKAVYFAAIVVNILLRLVWMQLVLDFQEAPFLHRRALTAVVACLEIIRRGIWNFFRLENEHFNNVGKFRAFKSVPLPFHYEEEEDDGDEKSL